MIKLGIIYGGISTEHDVSEMSAKSVIENLDKEKYEVHKIYINEYGKWFEEDNDKKEEIYNLVWTLKDLDVVFPVLHGIGGEDGTIQGMLEMLKVPYVGCGVLSSSIGMDKVYTKIIFEKAGIQEAPYIYIKKHEDKYMIVNENFDEEEFNIEKITGKLKFPMFVKPSNSGSSVGVKKATNNGELKMAIENAAQFDNKILVEQGIEGKEVECAILDGKEIIASTVGEIVPAEEFYSFDAKYNIPESKTIIPANIEEIQIEEIRKIAKKAFKAVDGKGLARVDFFIEKETNKIYINEINTMPGFTKISMYPKLFEAQGITYSELLDKLIERVIK
ncbi:MAG: D-alanine--D-alanine ligase family protein [Clostridia bacterium]